MVLESAAEREEWFTKLARTLAWDYDGTLHPYTAGWVGSTPADEPPIPGVEDMLRKYKEAGFRNIVFSARCDHEEGLSGTCAWLKKYGLDQYIDGVTCQKPAAVAYIDDRAVPFAGDWDAVDAGIERLVAGRPHGAGTA